MTTHTNKQKQSVTAWTDLPPIYNNLLIAKEQVYDQCNFICSQPIAETESADYAACTFTINGLFIHYRAAKITPTKTGQFVTIWKRVSNGPIEPFHVTDKLDFIIISVCKNECLGQFVFPKAVLLQKGIISNSTKEGKRGMRVYPPWDMTTSKQAEKTQKWQCKYFISITGNNPPDLQLFKKLFINDN